MSTSLFKYKKYINGIGFYASIEMEIEPEDNQTQLKIDFDLPNVEAEWICAIESGIKYFFEHYLRTHKKGLKVFVRKLHTMTVDSSFFVVFFVTVKCLCQALDYPDSLIDIDDTSAMFTVKK